MSLSIISHEAEEAGLPTQWQPEPEILSFKMALQKHKHIRCPFQVASVYSEIYQFLSILQHHIYAVCVCFGPQQDSINRHMPHICGEITDKHLSESPANSFMRTKCFLHVHTLHCFTVLDY